MKKIKVAIFGTGFMGREHTESLRRLGSVDVVSVAGSTLERTQKFAEEVGIERASGDYRELLADPAVDAVHICSPNSLHYEMTMAALHAGKHVGCEKPLASNMQEAREMVALARSKDLANCTLFNIRSYPQIQNLRRMREAGELGDIRVVQGTYSQDWLFYDTDWNWRIKSQVAHLRGYRNPLVRPGRAPDGLTHQLPLRRSADVYEDEEETEGVSRDVSRQGFEA